MLSQITPILSFEHADDFVMDVKWSPIHPALFACVDAGGRLSLYHLNREVHVPIASVDLSEPGGPRVMLNKVAWDREGKHVATGSADGKLHILALGELAQPKSDEWTMLQKHISKWDSK